MQLDLTDTELAALTRLLERTLDSDRYPLSPRRRPLKAILAKLQPPPLLGTSAAPEDLRSSESSQRRPR